ncbi:MAG TPA: hypothetical protein VMK05_05095 [Burkholderiales bacterium]|nr:hypothetical protein [Burkholderiales bacterium]
MTADEHNNAAASRTIMIMAGGTGGHIFSSGRASRRMRTSMRLTSAMRWLAFTEDMPGSRHAS